MNNDFIWNGVSCAVYGIHVITSPPPAIPAARVKFTEINGRAGSIAVVEGEYVYEDINMTVECSVENPDNVSNIAAWLSGAGSVVFGNRPHVRYDARVTNQIDFETVLRGLKHRRFDIIFRCSPFGYIWPPAAPIELTECPALLNNPGSAPSEPKITVYGSGEFSLTIGLETIVLSGVEGGIVLDSRLLDAFNLDETLLANEQVSGEFLILPPGPSYVSWAAEAGEGTVSKVIIEPRWRTM